MDAELNVTDRGVVEVTPDEFGTVRISWPDGTTTELRRAPEGADLIRLRTYAADDSIARLLIQENYGRPNGQRKLITGLQIERVARARTREEREIELHGRTLTRFERERLHEQEQEAIHGDSPFVDLDRD